MLLKLCPSYQVCSSSHHQGGDQSCAADLQEAGEVFVIGTADCGQLGLGEDVTEVLHARLSSIASGQKVRTARPNHTRTCAIAEVTLHVCLSTLCSSTGSVVLCILPCLSS